MSANPAQQGADPGAKKSLRDDALSVFLIVAALVLGGMYLFDQWQSATLEEQAVRAQWIGERFAIDGAECRVSSTGLYGEVLVFDCGGLAAPKLARAASGADEISSALDDFDRVVFVGAAYQLYCPAERTAWPDQCHRQAFPEMTDQE